MDKSERPCVRIFGQARGDAMHEFIERRTGDTCPCLKGIGCPMLNEQGESPLLMPVPKPRPGHTNSAHAVGLAGMFYSLSPLLKLAGAS